MGLFSRKPKVEKKDKISLKVLEAYTGDVGKGVARLDPKSMESLGISVGDIVQINGEKNTVAKCLPLYDSDHGTAIIRIDGLTRNNSSVKLGDIATISKVSAVQAESVSVKPLEAIPPIDERYLADSLESVPMIEGDYLMVPYFGGRISFCVSKTIPSGIVLVTHKTIFQIEDAPTNNGSTEQPTESKDNRFLDIIKERYAKGEITKEEFEQMKEDLKD